MLAILLSATVVLSGVGGWLLTSRNEPAAPAMAVVSAQQISEAIPTLSPSSQTLALQDNRQCPRNPLGFVTVMTPGNPAGATISFRTSKYQSPQFRVTDKPQQIAIPNPLPESGGLDPLSIDGEATGLVVSLYPAVRIERLGGTTALTVRWPARPPCK